MEKDLNREELEQKVKEIIEKEIRPALQMDGGDIEFLGLDDEGTVKVRLLGACGACPFSVMTLKMGVEQSLKNMVPGIKQVVAI